MPLHLYSLSFPVESSTHCHFYRERGREKKRVNGGLGETGHSRKAVSTWDTWVLSLLKQAHISRPFSLSLCLTHTYTENYFEQGQCTHLHFLCMCWKLFVTNDPCLYHTSDAAQVNSGNCMHCVILRFCVCVFVHAYMCLGWLSGENRLPDLCLLSLSSVITMQCQCLLVKSLVNEELELSSFHLTRWCLGPVRSLRVRQCYKSLRMMLCTSLLETKRCLKMGIVIQFHGFLVLGCFSLPK